MLFAPNVDYLNGAAEHKIIVLQDTVIIKAGK